MPIHDKVQYYAKHYPERIAVVIDDEKINYQQLWQNVGLLYNYLMLLPEAKSRDYLPNNNSRIIAVALGNHIRFPEAYLAATAYPNICVILDPQMPSSQIQEILIKLQADLLIADPDNQTLNKIAQQLNLPYLAYHKAPTMHHSQIMPIDTRLDGNHLICFTSGSSSLPKAYLRSRHSWRVSFEQGYQLFFLDQINTTFCACPIAYSLGLYCFNEVLFTGGSFYSITKWHNKTVAQQLKSQSIDRLVVVPSMIVSLNKWFRQYHQPLPNLRYFLIAGAKLDLNKYKTIRQILPNATIQEYYGASELGFIAVSKLNDDNVEQIISSVGTAFPSVNITIRDANGHFLPSGETGIIYVNSPLIAERYLWGADQQSFTINQHGATVNDIGYLDTENRLHVLGRAGGMMLTGGYNVYPTEVENVLRNLPEVLEVAVVALPDNYLGHKIVAIIESEKDYDYDDIYQYCSTYLVKYKIPREIYTIPQWPTNANGKIRYHELVQMIMQKESNLVKLSSTSR